MKERRMLNPSPASRGAVFQGLLILVLLTTSLIACGKIIESTPEMKQIATSADLHTLAAKLQNTADANGGALSDSQARKIIAGFGDGVDRWGNALIFLARRGEGLDFLLISPGSDGTLDVDDASFYFTAERREVTGDFEADLVNRNVERLRVAGK